MKVFGRLAAVLVSLLLLPLPTSGQASLGFQGGLSLATFGGSDIEDVSYKAGLGIGALVEISLSDRLSLQPEISFMQKGAKETEEGVDISFKLNYIEIPLLLKIDIPTEGTTVPYLLVGPALGIKAGCTISGEEGGVSVDVDCDEADVDVTAFDLGGMIGAGLGFAQGPGEIILSARFNFGFMTIDDSEYEDDVKNRGFSFMAGYKFPVGG